MAGAREALARGDIAKAEALATREIEHHPADPEAHFLLGRIELREGRTAGAEHEFMFLHGDPAAPSRIADAFREAASF